MRLKLKWFVSISDVRHVQESGRTQQTSLKFTCAVCNKQYKSKSSLCQHMDIHSTEEFVCPLCNKKFSGLKTLKQHSASHRNEKPYVCHVCGKAFKSNSSLYHHKFIHTGKRIECKTCKRTFAYQTGYRNHLKRSCLRDDGKRRDDCSYWNFKQ